MYNDPSLYPYAPLHYYAYPPHPYHYAPYWAWDRDYPPIDTNQLKNSVVLSDSMLKDATLIVNKLGDPAVAKQLMASAQSGNHKEVDRIVHTFGSKSDVHTTYTPSTVQFVLGPKTAGGAPCCRLMLSLKWGD
ncbi:hypothetical protein ABE504_20395 [Paenibacillus oryzisoli]|uniref:hypothetical protein n=1 Tax=Paenibacillus oryzisoli TaxID=1850517 RepID=UPI003D29EE05